MTLAQGTQLALRNNLAARRGWDGRVYRARRTVEPRVAINSARLVLPTRSSAAIQQEARSSALNHPNILTVYDIGSASLNLGSPYHRCRLLEGEELRAQLNDGAMAPRKRWTTPTDCSRTRRIARERHHSRDLKQEISSYNRRASQILRLRWRSSDPNA